MPTTKLKILALQSARWNKLPVLTAYSIAAASHLRRPAYFTLATLAPSGPPTSARSNTTACSSFATRTSTLSAPSPNSPRPCWTTCLTGRPLAGRPRRRRSLPPYRQSQRREFYLGAWRELRDSGAIYPCTCSRKDLALAASAPNDSDDEPLYNGHCRDKISEAGNNAEPKGINWRFHVPDGETIEFVDQHQGLQSYIAGHDFGDFVIWRRDDVPAYQLAVVVDDAAMQITEIVRGADLLKSTARQLLLIRALGLPIPAYFHCDLVRDESGTRLAKRNDALSLRTLRDSGKTPAEVLSLCPGYQP